MNSAVESTNALREIKRKKKKSNSAVNTTWEQSLAHDGERERPLKRIQLRP